MREVIYSSEGKKVVLYGPFTREERKNITEIMAHNVEPKGDSKRSMCFELPPEFTKDDEIYFEELAREDMLKVRAHRRWIIKEEGT